MLTAEQQGLVENNERFIYYVLQKLRLSVNDFYGTAAVGLCKAAQAWDSSKSKFATFAFRCIENECLMELRKSKGKSQYTFFSLDQKIYEDGGEDTAYLQIPDESAEDGFDAVESKSDVQKALSEAGLSEKEAEVVGLCQNGLTQNQIKDLAGISQPYVSRILRRAKKKIRARLCAE